MSEPTSGGGQQPDPDPEKVPPLNNPYAPVPPTQPYAQQPPAPPLANPYAPQPPVQSYAQQPPPPPPPYGQPQPGQPYPAYGQQPYATGPHSETNVSGIVLTIVSALFTLSTCVIGIPSLVFGIMALTSNNTDPVGSRKKAKTGWIIFAVNAGVMILVLIGFIALLVVNGTSSSTNFGTN